MTLFAALEKYEVRRNRIGHWAEQHLPEDPGIVHAFASYRASKSQTNRPEFFEGIGGPMCVCGQQIKVRLAVRFSVEDPDACPRCVELVATGVTRNEAAWRPPPRCDERVVVDGQIYTCTRRYPHRDKDHRADTGETWETGPDDWTPAPDGYV